MSSTTKSKVPIHFLHIGKTGGTAITEVLSPVAERFSIVLHSHSTKLADVPPHHQVFFFVRHPVSRFVSGFFSRLRRGAPRYNYEWTEAEARAFTYFQNPNDLAEALSAVKRETRRRAQDAMRGIQHVNSSYRDWFGAEQKLHQRLNSIVLIGLQEQMWQDFERLKRILSLPLTLSLPEDEVLAHRTPTGFDRHLTPVAKRNLCEWYLEDIHFYEYCLRLRALRGW